MRRLAIALALGAAVGCTGNIQDGSSTGGNGSGSNGSGSNGSGSNGSGSNGSGSNGSGSNGSGSNGSGSNGSGNGTMDPPSAEVTCPANSTGDIVGKRTLRRLTIPELETTIRATFGLDAKQWTGLNVPPDSGSDDGFTNNVDRLTVSPEYARGTEESSRAVATLVTSDAMLTKLLPCAATGGATCADTFITTFGSKLYRRPLTSTEKARYMALLDKTKAEDFKSFVFWATSTMLQSPNVIYRSELGESDGKGRFKLTPYEVASQLSYMFTGGPPTPELLQLAAGNKLGTADEVEAAARGLVYDGATVKAGFRDVLLRFSDQWLGLSRLANVKKDAMMYPDFTSQVQDAMAEETRQFISSVLIDNKGKVSDLFTAPYTFVNGTLAKYYGFGDTAATGFTKVDRPAQWGVGLLSQGSMLAVLANGLSTSPTRRGHLVRTTLMCYTVPPPPPTVNPVAPSDGAKTTRQRYEDLHSKEPSCHSCHQMMDPIGFAFEHIDSAGRYRDKENSFDIDDSATILGSSKGDLSVKGPTELGKAIAGLPEVNDCMAAYLAAYALGVSHDSAQCLVGSAISQLRTGSSVVDFYVKMARSDHFRFRQ